MVSAQGAKKDLIKKEMTELWSTFCVWRKKTFWQKLLDVFCAIVFTGFFLVLLYLIMLSSEYGGNG